MMTCDSECDRYLFAIQISSQQINTKIVLHAIRDEMQLKIAYLTTSDIIIRKIQWMNVDYPPKTSLDGILVGILFSVKCVS